jgi:hypothetical protein
MSNTSRTLTLISSGTGGCEPNYNPWKPPKSGPVNIINNSGVQQLLTNVSRGLLAPAPHKTVTVPITGWSGAVGNKKGTYQYEDGLEDMGVRNGTIDPS